MESPSATLAPAIAFAPTEAGLDAALALLAERAGDGGGAVEPALRREALARFAALPAPGARPSRGWRYDYAKLDYAGLGWSSDRATLAAEPYRPVGENPDPDGPALETANAAGLVHVGSTWFEPRDTARFDPRIVVTSLARAMVDHADAIGRVRDGGVDWRADKFAALSTAFQNCGAFVYVPDGVVVDAPIALLWSSRAHENDAVFPHVVVVLGAGARATVIERYVGDGDAFVSAIVNAHLGDGAQLDYAVVQQTSDATRFFARRSAVCGRDAHARWHVADLGGGLVRDVLDAHLPNPGSDAEVSALFFNTAGQHVDLGTTVDHASGDTTSTTVVRSAAIDRGQGRYLGNIRIRAGAHGSNASLRDDALLLSRTAHIDSVPALEIAANDVKAFHGATVGSLDEDELFYAQSRGFSRPDAIRMVALGFFEPAVSRFPTERLREEIRTALDEKIDVATGETP